MAFSFIQTKQLSGTTVTSLVITPTSSLTQNHLVIVNIKFFSLGVSAISVTDNASTPNTYAVAVPLTSAATFDCMQFYGVQVTGGATTVTISWTGSSNIRATVDEFSGNMSTNAAVFDTYSTATDTSTAASLTFSPTNSGELISAACAITTTGVTVNSGYTNTQSAANQVVEYKLSGTTSETPGWTLGTSQGWNLIAGAYIPSVAPTSTPGASLTTLGVG